MRGYFVMKSIAWIFRNEEYVTTQFIMIIPGELGTLFWSCTLDRNDLKNFVKTDQGNAFWIEIVELWFLTTWEMYGKIDSVNQVKEQILWCNSWVRINGKPTFHRKAAQLGIIYVTDVIRANGTSKSYQEICEDFPDAITWFEYISLIDAIPTEWKKILRRNTRNDKDFSHLFDLVNDKNKTTSILYSSY